MSDESDPELAALENWLSMGDSYHSRYTRFFPFFDVNVGSNAPDEAYYLEERGLSLHYFGAVRPREWHYFHRPALVSIIDRMCGMKIRHCARFDGTYQTDPPT